MKFLYFLALIFTISLSAYESIELSQNKKDLSKEIYSKLEKDHFLKKKDKTDFNKKYIQNFSWWSGYSIS